MHTGSRIGEYYDAIYRHFSIGDLLREFLSHSGNIELNVPDRIAKGRFAEKAKQPG